MNKDPALKGSPTQEAARNVVRTLMRVTGWSASRLATEAGLAASTVNRFMNQDVKHTLKFSTLARLLATALRHLDERLAQDPEGAAGDVALVLPLIERFGIDLEAEAKRLAESGDVADPKPLETLIEAARVLTAQEKRAEIGHLEPAAYGASGLSESLTKGPARYDLPVLGAAKGGSDSLFFDNGVVHERIRRPPNLEGVDNAFAVYMVGDSMEPRYFAGEFLFVNPNRPPSRNCFVVVELTDGQGLVKQFIRRTSRALHLRQFNPRKDLTIDNREVKSVYRIVGTGEP